MLSREKRSGAMAVKRTVLIRWIQTPATFAPHGGMTCPDVLVVLLKTRRGFLSLPLLRNVQWL